MKSKKLTCIILVGLVLFVRPIRIGAQEQSPSHREHNRYKVVDLGTFGGMKTCSWSRRSPISPETGHPQSGR